MPTSSADDLQVCRRLLQAGSRSFHAASRVLPRGLRAPTAALYAFCRIADDHVDDAGGPVEVLRARLDDVYRSAPRPHPVDRAFSAVVARFAIPRPVVELLLEGFEWDREGRRYETIGDVRAYGVRVASTVGVMMTLLMGRREPAVLARACDLGVAMQLTNIARDVGEDARAGRLYLPRAWLREAGIDPDAWLAAPVFTPALGAVVARTLGEADRLYRRAEAGVPWLPRAARVAIRAAGLIYADIGRVIRRRGLDTVSGRARTGPWRKATLLARAGAATLWRRRPLDEPPLTEAAPLIAAAAAQ